MNKKFDHVAIEKKWQEKWAKDKTYQPDLAKAKKPFYNLMMFPYPSAEGLHVGNMYAFTGADVYGRFQRMQGNDVFEPIGLDGFGIHSENYALKIGKHPAEQAKVSQENFYRQLHEIGNGFAWDNKLETYDPDYYKWTQWLFVQMYKNGLAYRGKAMVNWCPKDKTVLADEQVEAGVCERCKTPVERRPMKQWFFKITEYADRLLANIEKINWPEKIKIAQRQWIGKKEGTEVEWEIEGNGRKISTFTTRLDTIFGVTFLVLAPEHELVPLIATAAGPEVSNYLHEATFKTEQQRKIEEKDKKGVFTGSYAIHPITKERIPIWIGDFVLAGMGTGAVMGVPAHDERDFEFAKKYKLIIRNVVAPLVGAGNKAGTSPATTKEAFVDDGKLINSEGFNEVQSSEARKKIAEKFSTVIKKVFNYHLRDWLISRQRYWGPPIPMIHCEKCGWSPVPEDQLPVLLPDLKDWQPKGNGRGPLENAPEEWLYTKCPKCGGRAKRETDVSDTFLDSSWYFLKYPSVTSSRHSERPKGVEESHSTSGELGGMRSFANAQDDKARLPWDPEITKKWLPVNAYIGGAEHAVLHLLYARFVWMALKDWGFLKDIESDEPFPFLFSHGLLIKDGAKMSKSRGNVIIPDSYIKQYGADTLRMYLMFLGPYDHGGDFRDTGILGMRKFLDRVWNLLTDEKKVTEKTTKETEVKLHQTIKDIKEGVGAFQYNTSIARFMELVNILKQENETISHTDALSMIKLIAPFAPHITEELWKEFGQKESIHIQRWPEYDEKLLVKDEVTIAVQVNGKLRATLIMSSKQSTVKEKVIKLAKHDEKAKQYLNKEEIKKEIFIPGKLVNFVIS